MKSLLQFIRVMTTSSFDLAMSEYRNETDHLYEKVILNEPAKSHDHNRNSIPADHLRYYHAPGIMQRNAA